MAMAAMGETGLGSDLLGTDLGVGAPYRGADSFEHLEGHIEVAGHGARPTHAQRAALPTRRAAHAVQQTRHARIVDGDQLAYAGGHAGLDHGTEQLAGHLTDRGERAAAHAGALDREAAAFPDADIMRRRAAVQQLRENVAQHVRAGREEESPGTDYRLLFVDREQINRLQAVKLIALQPVADRDVPAQTVLEDAAAQTMHLLELAPVGRVVGSCHEMDHLGSPHPADVVALCGALDSTRAPAGTSRIRGGAQGSAGRAPSVPPGWVAYGVLARA